MTSNTCYMCSRQATTVEHAPPRCLFPTAKDSKNGKGLRKNLITVPSCEEHNSEKSKNDEYFLYVLSASITSSDTGLHLFLTKVQRAAKRKPALAIQLHKKVAPVGLQNVETKEILEAFAIEIDGSRVDSVLAQCAKAIYFKVTGRKCLGEANVVTAFSLLKNNKEMNDTVANGFVVAEEQLSTQKAHGENPEVFYFKIVHETNSAIIFMVFYESTRAIVRLRYC